MLGKGPYLVLQSSSSKAQSGGRAENKVALIARCQCDHSMGCYTSEKDNKI